MANNVIDAAIRLRDLFTPTVRSVNASLETMKTQMAAAKQSVSGLSDKLTEHERIQKRTAKSIEQTGSKISGLSDKMALLSAPILAAATAGFKLHSDFANGIAKISTLVDTTVVSMQKVSDEIRAVSDETGAGVADLSESVYQAISAGVDAAHAVGFVKDMTIAAKAGFTDTTTAVNGVTTVLNAYGKSAEEAMAVTDQMLLAQNFGKTSFGEMAQSMGNVIPIAAQLNVSTQELFGSIAVLTKNGIRTSEAITGLKAAYSNILKPSAEAAKLAQSLGLEFNAAHLQSVGWVKFLEHQFPDLIYMPSSAKSPQQMFGAIAKSYYAQKIGVEPKDLVVVSVMPCLSKKYEAAREEFSHNGVRDVDIVISTRELADMIREAGILFDQLEDGVYDSPLGESTGAAVIFGATGGVLEAALRTAADWVAGADLQKIDFNDVRGLAGIKEATVQVGSLELRVAVCSGLGNARKLLEKIQRGEVNYHAIEIMACPGGCLNGGGQPYHHGDSSVLEKRLAALYRDDASMPIRKSHQNPSIQKLYEEFLGEPGSHAAHQLLHTSYISRGK